MNRVLLLRNMQVPIYRVRSPRDYALPGHPNHASGNGDDVHVSLNGRAERGATEVPRWQQEARRVPERPSSVEFAALTPFVAKVTTP